MSSTCCKKYLCLYFYFLFYSDVASSKCSSPISRTESIYKSESSLAMSISSANKPVAVNSMKTLASQIVAYHFCQSDNAPSCLIPEFIHRFEIFYFISKSNNLQYNMLCCWVDRLIHQASDGPSIILIGWKQDSAHRCVLPVSFPVDLLLWQ